MYSKCIVFAVTFQCSPPTKVNYQKEATIRHIAELSGGINADGKP
jgi:hypothetical protein